jgi:hypothetical protein
MADLHMREQVDRARRIGVLMAFPESDSQGQNYVAAFREGLQRAWVDGWPQCSD